MSGLTWQYSIILSNETVLWYQVSQKAQITPNFSTSSTTFFFFCSTDQKHILGYNGPTGALPPQGKEVCSLHILDRKDDSVEITNSMVKPYCFFSFTLFLPKDPILKWNGACSKFSLGKILLLSLDFYWHAGKLTSLL